MPTYSPEHAALFLVRSLTILSFVYTFVLLFYMLKLLLSRPQTPACTSWRRSMLSPGLDVVFRFLAEDSYSSFDPHFLLQVDL